MESEKLNISVLLYDDELASMWGISMDELKTMLDLYYSYPDLWLGSVLLSSKTTPGDGYIAYYTGILH